MSERKLVELAQGELPGDDVQAAGVFQPRGTSALMTGVPIAGAVGGEVAAAAEEEPLHTLLALTPTHLHAFALADLSLGWKLRGRFAAWDLDDVSVTTHQRVAVRVLEIADRRSGATYEFESPRVGDWHGGQVIDALVERAAR